MLGITITSFFIDMFDEHVGLTGWMFSFQQMSTEHAKMGLKCVFILGTDTDGFKMYTMEKIIEIHITQ
jgi:hypothetical protein